MNNIEIYIKEFLSDLQFVKRRAKSTINIYNKILNQYIKYVNDYGLNKISFLNYLESISNLSQNTIKLRIIVIKSFLNYLHDNNYIKDNNYWKSASTKSPEETPKGLTDNQIEVLFKTINNNFDYIFFDLIVTMGLRISEALNLKKENFIFHNKYCEVVIIGKGKKERVLKISNDYASKLVNNKNNYIFEKNNKPPTIRTMQRKFKNYVELANKKINSINKKNKTNINLIEATPHALRHTCAKKLLNNGKTIEEVRYILGHTSISTTGIYLRSNSHTSLLDFDNKKNH